MKLFIISDIHGSLYYLKKVMEIFEKENYDKLVILGDELYHGPRNPLPMSEGDILLYGHFHIPMIEKKDERYFFNPGSISLPKNNSNHSFAILDETKFQIKDLDENILMEINF